MIGFAIFLFSQVLGLFHDASTMPDFGFWVVLTDRLFTAGTDLDAVDLHLLHFLDLVINTLGKARPGGGFAGEERTPIKTFDPKLKFHGVSFFLTADSSLHYSTIHCASQPLTQAAFGFERAERSIGLLTAKPIPADFDDFDVSGFAVVLESDLLTNFDVFDWHCFFSLVGDVVSYSLILLYISSIASPKHDSFLIFLGIVVTR